MILRIQLGSIILSSVGKVATLWIHTLHKINASRRRNIIQPKDCSYRTMRIFHKSSYPKKHFYVQVKMQLLICVVKSFVQLTPPNNNYKLRTQTLCWFEWRKQAMARSIPNYSASENMIVSVIIIAPMQIPPYMLVGRLHFCASGISSFQLTEIMTPLTNIKV